MRLIIYVGETGDGCREDLGKAFDRIGLSEQLSKASKVFVKANFTYPHYTPGVTTSPKFLRQVLDLARRYGAEVFVGDSNGGYGSFLAREAFEGHGLPDICISTKTKLLNLSEIEARTYTGEVAGRTTSVVLPRFLVEDVDLTISVPVLKVHVMTTVSLSVKNLWGCSPLDLRLLQHARIDRKLRLIAELCKARFGIIDGTYGLDEHGPMDGVARPIGKFVAGNDLYGLDWITSGMMGFNPKVIQHLQMISRTLRDSIRIKNVESNLDFSNVDWRFRLGFNLIDTLSYGPFHSDTLARLIYQSPLTRQIYALFGKTPRRRLQ